MKRFFSAGPTFSHGQTSKPLLLLFPSQIRASDLEEPSSNDVHTVNDGEGVCSAIVQVGCVNSGGTRGVKINSKTMRTSLMDGPFDACGRASTFLRGVL